MRYLVVFFLLISFIGRAQEIKPKGQFLADSIKIGEPVGFSLSLKYPRELDVVFPDSLYDFAPYELENKVYFETKSDSTYSYDSAVYYISSFEIDSVQYLQLPIFVLQYKDSTTILTDTDSVILKHLVEEVPDSVSAEAAPLIENTNYINVPLEFNYPYLIIGAVILVLALVIVYVIFGGKIKTAFKLRKLRKKHEQFINRLDQLIKKQNGTSQKLAENILIHWKKYIESLENKPFTKLTTKEIIIKYNPESIVNNLKSVDRAIYSPVLEQNIEEHYQGLKNYAIERYNNKIEEVKHG
ncbi:hypothetical protein E1176_06855 [Fulvivirga sp. RKSG066]|uniref:hypothetical protein n=1 Tax=Fulvivirga aurantia TaxID=2529383 RepID=UPI0012BBCD19|nr:hypothetical protein [Fulvivirga aurantia]MTI20735.1 hypothetical protein [Fulvivirga aurantia]